MLFTTIAGNLTAYRDACWPRTIFSWRYWKIENIVILSESLAEESGISDSNVSVCAMTMDGIPLGIGNYYSSTGKAIIDTNDCPEV